MLSCRQLVEETSSLSLEELQQQRWSVRLHLLMCRHCRRYVRQLKAMLGVLPYLHRLADDRTIEQIWQRIHLAKHDE